jgi:hypothetical protein
MNEREAAVVGGFMRLTALDKTNTYIEIEEIWKGFQQDNPVKRAEIEVKPVMGGCPCCGR